MENSRNQALELDRQDRLAPLRELFSLPPGRLYFDGNSLGAMPKATAQRLRVLVEQEWAEGLVGSWESAGWMESPRRVGAKIARLIGAEAGSCIIGESTSVLLYKALAAALPMRPQRRTILTDQDNFPTDLYIIDALAAAQNLTVIRAPRAEIKHNLGSDVAVMAVTHVDYRSGEMLDLADLTAAAHKAGALAVWDLSHSTGAVPLNMQQDQVDFAVGCGYKYLNGGPGAPAFIYAAARHHEQLYNPIAGWLGHAQPFLFAPDYEPAPGVARMLSGSPSVLAIAALECAVDIFLNTEMELVREKSLALSDFFIKLIEDTCDGTGLRVVTPAEHSRRGSQVSLAHETQAYALSRALIERQVIVDFRPPDIVRFGLPALYTRFIDVYDAVMQLADICETHAHMAFQGQERATIP